MMNRSALLLASVLLLSLSCGGTEPTGTGGGGGGGAGGGGGTGGGRGAGGGGGTGGGRGTGGGGGSSVDDGGTGGGSGGGGGGAAECTPGSSRACCTSGVQYCGVSSTWDACSVASQPEVCNGVDDDCNGQVDDGATPTLEELLDAGFQPDAGCSTGVGACARTGGALCGPSGRVTCDATAGTPGTETCNSVDDNCDGQVDEGLTISCLSDGDNDGYASDAVALSQCPDTTRPTFGNCPMGFVAPASSLGIDCAPTDASLYAMRAARRDADGDSACAGTTVQACAGSAGLPAGYIDPLLCTTFGDCDDTDGTKFQQLSVRADADNDEYCTSAVSAQCSGANPQPGYRLAASCKPADDCDDTTNTRFQMLSVRADGDGDLSCTPAPAFSQCTGVNPLPGYIVASRCTTWNDCDDANAAAWRLGTLRRDQDNDGYCLNTTDLSRCIGLNAPSGYQFATSCPATLDCRDSNPYVGLTCSKSILSSQASKWCGTQPVVETLTFTYDCGPGYLTVSATAERQASTCGTSCTQLDAPIGFPGTTSQTASFRCNFAAIGHDEWRLRVGCSAY
ncbi:MAG: hypothetical protein AMXMBFR34_21530 [Myxococcaceae bacterium]